ncbi:MULTISPECIES: integrase [Streptomyces]|uniref:integrase n=1 Tax=Streptomyces TaxID=1883 RepID=UPI0018DF6A06|nr:MULTISPECIES: integrase [Streptomyces]MCZ4102161.1 integrase [Streptomyces sp. H39-C1]
MPRDCYVHEATGLALLPGSARSRFEEDLWDMWGLADKPRSIKQHELTWDFSQIMNPKWRVVAKEILIALLAPQHDSVLECALALRKYRSPRTCNRFLRKFTAWFNWLTANGVTSLEEVMQEHCDRFTSEDQWYVPKPGAPPVQVEPETLAESVRVVQLITLYGDLLSTDSYRAGFVPWDGRSTIKVVGGTWLRGNRTPPVPDHLLQPALATCLYLVNTVGPHLADLVEQARADAARTKGFPRGTLAHVPDLKRLFAQMHVDRVPLPLADGKGRARRISTGDLAPLKDLAWYRLAHQVGTSTIADLFLREKITPELLVLAEDVGFENYWARTAPTVAREEDGASVPWTAPLSDAGLQSMVANTLVACLVVTSALSGMRNSELVELNVGCRRQTVTKSGGTRYRLAGRLIKGQKLGGVPDDWVVIEDVHRAVALAEHLVGAPPGAALFNTVALSFGLTRMRKWLEETGNRERWGLPVIPAGPINARMLRRKLALSIAARPGGLLAAKIALKHISVATTEGYAARPADPSDCSSPRSRRPRKRSTWSSPWKRSATSRRAATPPVPAPAD